MKSLRLLIIALALSACYEDNSTLATKEISDIVIVALENERVIAYTGYVLERQPKITTNYAEDQLNYAWYLCRTIGGYQQQLIGSEKNLSYEVNLPAGSYTIVCEVSSKENSYTVTTSMALDVSTEFARGFYVLKETADGNTELDFHTSDTTSILDLLTKLEGAPMSGAPRTLSTLYNASHIDPDDPLVMNYGHALGIFTENNEFKIFRASDMARVFDRSNLLYSGPMEPDEIPYAMLRGYTKTYYFSSVGVRVASSSQDPGLAASGRMGVPVNAAALTPGANVGGSKYAQVSAGGQTVNYWNEQRHRLESVDSKAVDVTERPLNVLGADTLDRLQAVAHGIVSLPVKMTFFLLQDELTGDRYLTWINSAGTGLHATYGMQSLDPTLHLARSNMISANGRTAQLIYCVHENKLWAYEIATKTERELTLPAGIPAGTRLSYMTNLYDRLVSPAFDYIVLGTQEGNDYALYLYSVLGGQPDSLVYTFRGTGRVEKLRHLSPASVTALTWLFYHPSYPIY
jgi:hypothetical protein